MIKKAIAALLFTSALCSDVFAYSGTSDWAKKVLDEVNTSGFVPQTIFNSDVSKPITNGECASICVKYYETLRDTETVPAANPFENDVSTDVLKSVSVGIVGNYGYSVFDEGAKATREGIADMLARTYTAVSDKSAETERKELFADDFAISSWARESVYFIESNAVMNIVGSNKFAPSDTGTSIQSVLISLYKMNEIIGDIAGENLGKEQKTVGEICLEMIPDISFGLKEEPVINEESAVIVVNGAAQADFDNYIKKAQAAFPTFMYDLPGQNYKAVNGDYMINVTYQNGVFSVEVLKN